MESLALAKELFSHYTDIIKDIIFVLLIGKLVRGGGVFLKWVCINLRKGNILLLKPLFTISLGLWLIGWGNCCPFCYGIIKFGNDSKDVQYGIQQNY